MGTKTCRSYLSGRAYCLWHFVRLLEECLANGRLQSLRWPLLWMHRVRIPDGKGQTDSLMQHLRDSTLRVVVGEILDETNRAAGYGVWNLGATLGILLAPIAGGLLARPTENIAFFRSSTLFHTYPYLLPSLLTGLCGIVTLVLCFLYLEEVSLGSGC